MSIIACREVWRGETWSDSKDGSREYLMIFEVLSDDPSESAVTVRAHPDIPARWSSHPDDPAAVCVDRNSRRDDKSRLLWIVECRFAWGPEDEEDEEDPLDQNPKIRWTSQIVRRPVVKDRNGDAILNSAGTYFDPPIEVDFVRWTVNIQFNATEIPANIRQYAGAVNDSACEIDGEPIAAERSRIIALDIAEVDYWGEDQTAYRSITMAIEVRDEDDEDFELSILDQGLFQRGISGEPPTHIELLDSESGEYSKVSGPVLLNGFGFPLIDPHDVTQAHFIDFDNPAIRLMDLTIFPGIEAA